MRKKRYYGRPLNPTATRYAMWDDPVLSLAVLGVVGVTIGTIGYFIWKAAQPTQQVQVTGSLPQSQQSQQTLDNASVLFAATDINPLPLPPAPPGGVPLPVAPSV